MDDTFKPDYLCDNEKCRQVTRDLMSEYKSSAEHLQSKLTKAIKTLENEMEFAKKRNSTATEKMAYSNDYWRGNIVGLEFARQTLKEITNGH